MIKFITFKQSAGKTIKISKLFLYELKNLMDILIEAISVVFFAQKKYLDELMEL